MAETHLSHALRSLWTADHASARRRTLARLAQHNRQFEPWWKCELAAHLWDHVDRFGPDTHVWLEALDRADVTIATGVESQRGLRIAPDCTVCIPVELKTTGTWWGSTPSAIAKAFDERGQKRLSADMHDLRDQRRASRPFAAVGLLVTHVGSASDDVFGRYLEHARTLGRNHELEVLLDEAIELPDDDQEVSAHQIFWIARAPSSSTAAKLDESISPSRVHDAITVRQHEWMRGRGAECDRRGWAVHVEANLFEPLDPDVKADLEAADGNELAGKICAPWSSSALALNVFHFWRQRDNRVLAKALRRSTIASIRFEQCHATGNRNARANLDVEVRSEGEPVLAIESKLREPFGHHDQLLPSYLARADLWERLPHCFELAKRCEEHPTLFQRLDVAQLLKHILGLSRSYGRDFELLYLWYDPTKLMSGDEEWPIVQHRQELERFTAHVAPDVCFRSLTYQSLFDQLAPAESEYREYLRTRYFG